MSMTSMDGSSAQQVADYFAANPRGMTMVAARDLNLPEAEVVRYMPGGSVTELTANRFAEMMERLVEFGKTHVIVSNGVTTLESFGEFGKFSTWGEYFNVQTKSLDMHIRHEQIAAVFAVEKPSHMDGVSTLSFQFYDCDGKSAFKVFLTFGQKAASDECRARWQAFRDEFALSS